MKNILSSLNESEKRRILEMHYKASGKQIISEGFSIILTPAELSSVYATKAEVVGSDKPYGVSFTFLPEKQQKNENGTVANPTYLCTPRSSGGSYGSKFDNYAPYTNTKFGVDNTPIGIILDNMAILGKKQCDTSIKQTPKLTTTKPKTPQQQRIDLIKSTWSRESQRLVNVVDNNTNYFNFGYENYNDTPDFDNVSIKLFQSSNAPTLYKKVGTTEPAIYSCKTKTWAPSNHFGNTALEGKDPNANRNDIGKTPAQIAQSSVDTLCTLSTKKPQ
jgi:hypothetical protein